MKTLMSQQAHEIFLHLSNIAPKYYTSNLEVLSSKLIVKSRFWPNLSIFHSPEKLAKHFFYKEFNSIPQNILSILIIALTAKLALETPRLVCMENLTDSILGYYPAAFDRLSNVLHKTVDQPFDTAKGIFHRMGFVLALNIPCGAQLLDLRSSIPLSSAVLSVFRERSFNSLIRYFRCKGLGTWFRGHTDIEYLQEFNEEGWDMFYLRIAGLLQRRKHVRGLVGTSWFYDPKLVNISPRLSYLQQRQLDRGAYLMRHRGTESDIKFATKASKTRLHLYQQGKYTPISHSLIWGRNELLTWAQTEVVSQNWTSR